MALLESHVRNPYNQISYNHRGITEAEIVHCCFDAMLYYVVQRVLQESIILAPEFFSELCAKKVTLNSIQNEMKTNRNDPRT